MRDKLQGVKQEDPVLKDEGKLATQERLGTSGEEQVDGHSHHKQTIVMTSKEAAILDCDHVVIDSTNETMYWKPQSLAPRFDALADENNFNFFLVRDANRVAWIRET